MDCKNALVEANGDFETAIDILRKKGQKIAAKRGENEAKEGLIIAQASEDGKFGVLVTLNCETDFVAKNEGWRGFVSEVTAHALDSAADSVDALLGEAYSRGSGTVDEAVKSKGAETGEVTVLRRFVRFSGGTNSSVATYLHMGGKIGVMVEVKAGKPESLSAEPFRTLLKDLTMHIAAANPEYLQRSEVPEAVVAKEKEIYAASDRLKGKPAAALEGILNGMLNKFYSQVCLLEQGFIKDPDKSITDLLAETGKTLGDTLSIERFARFAVGEELKA